MPRRHLKKDEQTLQCGLKMTPKFQKALAPDRHSVTCGACELASRPKVVAAPKVETAPDWSPEGEAEGEGDAEPTGFDDAPKVD